MTTEGTRASLTGSKPEQPLPPVDGLQEEWRLQQRDTVRGEGIRASLTGSKPEQALPPSAAWITNGNVSSSSTVSLTELAQTQPVREGASLSKQCRLLTACTPKEQTGAVWATWCCLSGALYQVDGFQCHTLQVPLPLNCLHHDD